MLVPWVESSSSERVTAGLTPSVRRVRSRRGLSCSPAALFTFSVGEVAEAEVKVIGLGVMASTCATKPSCGVPVTLFSETVSEPSSSLEMRLMGVCSLRSSRRSLVEEVLRPL